MRRALLLAVVAGGVVGCGEEGKTEEDPVSPPASSLRIGHVMVEVGHRFETAGRAAEAGRWPLAEYEVHEILEVFDDDMARALLPGECQDQVVDPLFLALKNEQLPALRTAAGEADEAAFARAFATAAGSCNGCHAGCGVAFVEVPTEPGLRVPRIEVEPPGVPTPAPEVLDPWEGPRPSREPSPERSPSRSPSSRGAPVLH